MSLPPIESCGAPANTPELVLRNPKELTKGEYPPPAHYVCNAVTEQDCRRQSPALQSRHRHCGAAPSYAQQPGGLRRIDPINVIEQVGDVAVSRAFDVASFPLVRRPHVNDLVDAPFLQPTHELPQPDCLIRNQVGRVGKIEETTPLTRSKPIRTN